MRDVPLPPWVTQCQRSDAELLSDHHAGDPDAFAILLLRHRDRVSRVTRRLLPRDEDSADAVQETYLRAWRASGDFRGDCAVTTWLHRIALNVCLDRVRRPDPTRTADPLDGQDPPAPGDLAEQGAWHVTLVAALAGLPADQRDAVFLVHVAGQPVDEAARLLDCPVGTVKSRCARGRARLADALLDTGDRSPAAGRSGE